MHFCSLENENWKVSVDEGRPLPLILPLEKISKKKIYIFFNFGQKLLEPLLKENPKVPFTKWGDTPWIK